MFFLTCETEYVKYHNLEPLRPNSDKNGIWYRWQPILEITTRGDCVCYPAIDINGTLSEAFVWNFKGSVVDRCPNGKGQTYSRLWVTRNGHHQGLVYTWFFPWSGVYQKLLLTTVWWMETKTEALLGCSFYGIYDEILPNGFHHGWKHYRPSECQFRRVPDEWGQTRNVVSKWQDHLEPNGGSKRAVRGTPTLLVFDFMPDRLKTILANADFGNDFAKFMLGNRGWYGMPALYTLFQGFLSTWTIRGDVLIISAVHLFRSR